MTDKGGLPVHIYIYIKASMRPMVEKQAKVMEEALGAQTLEY